MGKKGSMHISLTEENIDTGDILRSVEYDINLEDTIVDIKDKNVKIAINNLKRYN